MNKIFRLSEILGQNYKETNTQPEKSYSRIHILSEYVEKNKELQVPKDGFGAPDNGETSPRGSFVPSKNAGDGSVEETRLEFAPNTIYQGHALEVLKNLPDESVDCVITSPPYWRLRCYHTEPVIWNEKKDCKHEWTQETLTGQKTPQAKYLAAEDAFTPTKSCFCSKCDAWKGELGGEPTPELFISHLCDIFDEVKRVLKPAGTCFVNIADSHANNGIYISKYLEKHPDHKDLHSKNSRRYPQRMKGYRGKGVKAKSLVGIPERFVLEMQNRGWIRRNTNIWHKPNCMPSSAKDRFTIDFEYLYFFVKNPQYYFEQQLEPCSESYLKDNRPSGVIRQRLYKNSKYNQHEFRPGLPKSGGENHAKRGEPVHSSKERRRSKKRNKRCVWSIPTANFKEAHFATFPEELVETPIKAGCPEGGIVLDPFAGAGTTCKVASDNGRQYVGIELNPEYRKMALERIESVEPIKRKRRPQVSELKTAGRADKANTHENTEQNEGRIVVLKPPADKMMKKAA